MAATLSVVVPVYGTKRDLPACLESLRTQSLRDAEFLLVDDASPDGAGAVLAEYARRDSRFRVLTHSQNRGLFAARMRRRASTSLFWTAMILYRWIFTVPLSHWRKKTTLTS